MFKRDLLKQQQSFFFLWFLVFFVLVISALLTQNSYLINTSLGMISLIGCKMIYGVYQEYNFDLYIRQHWPTSEYEVSKAEIIPFKRRCESRTMYRHDIDLQYRVKNAVYTTQHFWFQQRQHPSAENAENYINKIKAKEFGEYLHYNPENFEEAYLNPGWKFQYTIQIVFGIAFVFVPLLFVFGLVAV